MAGLSVYTGKGGAGVTTCAAAAARRYATTGRETALVSIDPTQSLSALLGTDVGPEPTRTRSGLTAVEINPVAGQETFRDTIERLADVASAAGIDLGDGHVSDLLGDVRLPFGREVAALEAVASFVGDASYDAVVFDTGLEGRLLRLLDRPELVGMSVDLASMAADEFHDRLDTEFGTIHDPIAGSGAHVDGMERDESDSGDDAPRADALMDEDAPTADDVEAIESRVETVRTVLSGEGRRELRIVTTPDRVAARSTENFVLNLKHAGLPVGPLVVNKVVEDGSCCTRCAARAAEHATVIAELEERQDLELLVLPDCYGTDTDDAILARLADRLVG